MFLNSRRSVLFTLFIFLFTNQLGAQRIVCDETCRVVDGPAYSVVSPVGEHTLRQYQGHIRRDENGEMTATPPWYDSPESELLTIPTMRRGMTAFLITGDPARNKVQTMPGGGYATVKIELPRNWDSLMEQLGYQPLKGFSLSDN